MRPYVRVLLSIGCLLILANMFVEYRGGIRYGDMQYFQSLAQRIIAHPQIPGSFASSFPFLATILFVVVSLNPFQLSFEVAWALALLSAYGFVVLYTFAFLHEHDVAWLLIALTLTAFFLHPVQLFGRLDGFVILLFFLIWKTYQRHHLLQCGFWVLIGIFFKLSPMFLLPLILLSLSAAECRRFLAGMVLGAVPLLVSALSFSGLAGLWENTVHLIVLRGSRPVDVLSSLSSIDIFFRFLLKKPPMIGRVPDEAYTNWNLSLPSWAPFALFLVVIAGTIVVALMARKRLRERRELFPLYMSMTMLWVVGTSPLFSSQHLFWVLPILFIWLLDQAEERGFWTWKNIVIFCTAAGVALSTRWITQHWGDLLTGKSLPVILMHMTRTSLLFTLIYLLYRQVRPATEYSPHT